MKYKLICIDVDGTLVNSNKEIPLENKESIKRVYDREVKIAIASGRSSIGVKELIEQLGIKAYEICLNGAYVKADNRVIKKEAMTMEQINQIVDIILKYNVCSYFNAEGCNITNKELSSNLKKTVANERRYIVVENEKLKLELMKYKNQILKVSICEPDPYIYEKVKKEIKKTNDLVAVSSDINYLDINMKNTNKASGVKALTKYLGINLEQVVCIGDNENDIEMLKEAGLGIAMANSCNNLMESCDVITESNDNCGVAKAIDKYII